MIMAPQEMREAVKLLEKELHQGIITERKEVKE
jgi:hypothetical protein